MTTIFAAFGKTLGNNKGSLQNFGIVGITVASEEFTKFIFFYCPCDYPRNQLYGMCFIWGPAIVLLIIGYLANRRTWRLTTGLCHRTQTFLGKGKKRIFHFIFIFSSIGIKALIAPATWVVLAFLKGDYYACARWPDPSSTYTSSAAYYQLKWKNDTLPKPCLFNPNPAKFNPNSDAEIIARTLRAESHVIGWLYLTTGMFLAVVVMFIFRCYGNFSYEQTNYIDRYREHEVELFEQKLDEKSKELAQRIVDGYFAKTRSKEEWDKIAVINDKVTRSKRGKAIYSPLHRFVNKELNKVDDADDEKLKSIKKEVAEGNLVQDAAMKKKHNLRKNTKAEVSKKNQGGNAATIPMQVLPVSSKTTIKTPYSPQKAVPEQKASEKEKDPKIFPPPIETSLSIKNETKEDPTSRTPAQERTIIVPSVQNKDRNQDASTLTESLLYEKDHPNKEENLNPETKVLSEEKKNSPEVQPATLDTTSETGSLRETSLGDFGGYYSREDVSKIDEVDGPTGAEQEEASDVGSEISVQNGDQYEKLESSEESPLLDNQ